MPRKVLLAVKLRNHRSAGEIGSEGKIEREARVRAAGSAWSRLATALRRLKSQIVGSPLFQGLSRSRRRIASHRPGTRGGAGGMVGRVQECREAVAEG